jgi:hypothetical protein
MLPFSVKIWLLKKSHLKQNDMFEK